MRNFKIDEAIELFAQIRENFDAVDKDFRIEANREAYLIDIRWDESCMGQYYPESKYYQVPKTLDITKKEIVLKFIEFDTKTNAFLLERNKILNKIQSYKQSEEIEIRNKLLVLDQCKVTYNAEEIKNQIKKSTEVILDKLRTELDEIVKKECLLQKEYQLFLGESNE